VFWNGSNKKEGEIVPLHVIIFSSFSDIVLARAKFVSVRAMAIFSSTDFVAEENKSIYRNVYCK